MTTPTPKAIAALAGQIQEVEDWLQTPLSDENRKQALRTLKRHKAILADMKARSEP